MKKTLHKALPMLFVGLLFALQSARAQTNYYVNASAPDDSGDGLTLGTAKKTIQAAINLAANGDIILLSAGTFDEQVLIDKSLTVQGASNTTSILKYSGTVPGGTTAALMKVTASNVIIKDIKFEVDLSKIHTAIITSGLVNNLTIQNNNIVATRTTASSLTYGWLNAIALNPNIPAIPGLIHINNPNPGNSCANYNITNNTISGTTITDNGVGNAFFRAGIQLDRIDGYLVANNTFNASVNHDVITRFLVGGDASITGNTFKGGGIEVSSSTNAVGKLVITGNNFDGAYSKLNEWAMLRLRINNSHREVQVNNNTFSDQKLAVAIEDFRDVTLENNTFTPSVDGFRLLNFNTKAATTGPSYPLQAIGAKLYSNTFNGLVGATTGIAIQFANFDQDGSNNYLNGTFEIGATGKQNIFNDNIPTYIAINNSNGVSTSDAGFKAAYVEFNDNYPATTTGYWAKNIRVDENQFYIEGQLRAPFNMAIVQRAALDAKIFDKKDNSNIGEVQYYFPVTNITTGLKYASIQSAIDAASVGDEITTLPGEYLEDVAVNKANLKLIGPGAGLATIKGVKGGTTTTLSVAATGAVVEGFTVTRDGNNAADWNDANGVLNSQGVSMDANNTTARKLVITGNRNGLYINNRQNVLVENCDIDNNRTGIQVVNNITGTIIRNNNIRNNWTMGFLFLDIAGGQTTGIDLVKNNITGNWYSQIEMRAANTNVLNFGANYLGSGAITVSPNPSGEPGYAAQIPTAFGGTATAPGISYKICGVHSDKADYSVALANYTDTDPAIGFQPDSTIVWVYENSPVATLSPKLTSASKIVAPNGTIVIKDATITSGGEITKDVTLDADVASVTINGDVTVNTTALTLAKATTIGGDFTLTKGKINVNSTIQLDAEGFSFTGNPATDYINGKIIANNVGNVTFPLGKGTKSSLVGLIRMSGSPSVFEIEYFPSAYANTTSFDAADIGAIYDKEYWSINRTSGDAEVRVGLTTLDFAASGFSSLAVGDAMVAMFDGSSWTSLGNIQHGVNDNKGYIMGYGSVSSGILTLAKSPTAILPVALLDFTAQITTGGALVRWSTAKEENNAKFEIEKSFDGKSFFIVDTRKGQGNSTTTFSYEFLDVNFKQSAYYRLVQVDANGRKTTYAALTKFVKGLDNSLSVVAYPNPVATKLYVTVGAASKENVKLLLTDLTGKTLKIKNADSTQPIELDVADIATGSYMLQVIKDSGNTTKKILKL